MSEILSQVKSALGAMYSNGDRDEKKQATQFLENFQKSQDAWSIIHNLLNDPEEKIEVKLFAAQTLRSKVTYDLAQIPQESLGQLKDSIIQTLIIYNLPNMKIIRTQLCIALSQLALQFFQWENAFNEITSKISQSNDSENILCLLDFLKILPEELSDVKKTSLTDDEFNERTKQLIVDNVEQVLMLLNNLTTNSNNTNLNSNILDCLNSWIKECPVESVLTIDSLTNLIFSSLTIDVTFEKAIECLCTILSETKDIDNYQLIDALYQQLLQLRSFMQSHEDDPEILSGLTRLYVEAGEAWHVLIAKNPDHFKPLVEILLYLCKIIEDLDVVRFTFIFWYLLKQLITLPKFESSKAKFVDIYTQLIEILIKHLLYPLDSNDNDLFDGDKEQEDKFKDFRYEVGDVLKDCCVVVGATKSLSIPFENIQSILNNNTESIKWQYLEASLFSMRTMAKEVPLSEKTILPTIMKYLVQLPEHPKIRYAATLVLGRYTEWTAKNPTFLEPQLNYIIKGFEIADSSNDKQLQDILIAASHAMMYFCQDCAELLVNYLEQLYLLFNRVKDQIDLESIIELADGLAHVIKRLPEQDLYKAISTFCNPTLQGLKNIVENGNANDENVLKFITNQAEVIATFVSVLRAKYFNKPNYPICDYFIDSIWPLILAILTKFGDDLTVSEGIMKLIKCAVQSFSTYLLPLLADIANTLHTQFSRNQFGCYLWVSGVVIREFGDEYVPDITKDAVFQFALQQSSLFFKMIENDTEGLKHIPDVIADFFRMMNDVLMFFPFQTVSSIDLLKSCWNASILALNSIDQVNTLFSVLHFLIDFVSWGLPNPPISFMEEDAPQVRETVQNFIELDNNGGHLIKVVLEGLIFHFNHDIQQDANDLILKILVSIPDKSISITWIREVVSTLPNVSTKEIEKIVNTVTVALPNKDHRRIRTSLKDFVHWYSKKNVTPRSEF